MKYVAIDIETTGLTPGVHRVLEIGAVLSDTTTNQLDSRWNRLILGGLGEDVTWDPVARDMNMVWYERDLINKDTLKTTLGRALLELADWLKHVGVEPTKIWPAGKNFASFDLQFLNKLPGYAEGVVRFKHRALDPAMLWFNPNFDDEIPSMDMCLDRAGLKNGKSLHRALVDAEMVVFLLKAGWEKGGRY